MGRSLTEMGKCLVIGHRGSPVSARENTLDSFRHAFEVGADGVELDVRRTLDHRLVVHHDPGWHDIEPADDQAIATESGASDAVRGLLPSRTDLAEADGARGDAAEGAPRSADEDRRPDAA